MEEKRKRGAPKGNTNAARGIMWREAIRRALVDKTKREGRDALTAIAHKLLEMCENGDIQAIKELGDRMDGKPTVIVGGDSDNPVITRIERVVIHKD